MQTSFSPVRGFVAATCAGLAAVAAPASAGSADQLLFEHVRLVDPSQSEPRVVEDAAVWVRDGVIGYAGAMADMPAAPRARRIDAGGLTLTPGLVDMHVHVWDAAELGAYLAAGITTVRNMSGMPFHLILQKRLQDGTLAGPRLLTSGPILNSPGANQQINHQMVETAIEARAAVAAQHASGFQRIKTYSNLNRAAYEALLDEARLRGMVVTGHTPEGERLSGVPQERDFAIAFDEILDDRFETIEHVESIVWHGLRDRHEVAPALALARRIAASGTPVTPTLVAHHNLVRVARSGGAFARRPGTELLNPVTQRLERQAIDFWSSQDPAPGARNDAFYARFTKMLDAAGVLLVTGSDAGIFVNIPGESLLDEIDLLASAGISPYRVLQAATSNAATVLDETGTAGCVAAGCRADLVLFGCDPLTAVACLRQPEAVVRAGRWYDRNALEAFRASAARHDPARTISNLVEGMAAQGAPIDPAMLGS